MPVGILSLLLTSRLIADPPYLKQQRRVGAKIDYLGFGLIALGLGTLQIVLDKGQRADWFETPYIRVFTMISWPSHRCRDLGVARERPDRGFTVI